MANIYRTSLSKLILCSLAIATVNSAMATPDKKIIKGQITDAYNNPLSNAQIFIKETNELKSTDDYGRFEFAALDAGTYHVSVQYLGFEPFDSTIVLNSSANPDLSISLQERRTNALGEVSVVAKRDKVEELDVLTRLPLKPNEQIQSITIISDSVIAKQGALTLSEASQNAAGVYVFSTYGNTKESISMRGYRGVPILKNGVRINSDFRGTGVLTDMQGLEQVQVLKGSAAVTQGIATDIGSPGGVINMVTKTPKFINAGNVSLRAGSWGHIRPAFDVQAVLDKNETVAFRLNGAYDRRNSYRVGIQSERIYVNPSIEWRPNSKTSITAEMDYLYDSRTPDPGTINLANYDSNAIFQLPYDRFPGFSSNRSINKGTTYSVRLLHKLNSKIYVRAAYFGSNLAVNSISTSLNQGSTAKGNLTLLNPTERYRTIGSSERWDNNQVFQLDLVGRNVSTGALKHTFMVGADFRTNKLSTQSSAMDKLSYVDIVDFNQDMSNDLPGKGFTYVPPVYDSNGNIVTPGSAKASNIVLKAGSEANSNSSAFGILAQDVISFKEYVKLIVGLRYSSQLSLSSATSTGYTTGTALDPQIGMIVSPSKNVHLFGSYTSSTSLSGAANVDTLGNKLGNQKIKQIEAGVKTNWFDGRLLANVTFYKINNRNLSIPVYDNNWNETGYYMKGGNDERKGVEIDVFGKISQHIDIMAGYSYINAQYKEHSSYYENSSPLNTPNHTANFWANYTVQQGALAGLGFGLGYMYTGERPINDWAKSVTHQGIIPGLQPFNLDPVSTLNAQISYQYEKFGIRLLGNNLLNKIGYAAYRTSYINQTDPRNVAVVLNYRF